MIAKSFELNNLSKKKYHFYLFYGENEGLKNETIDKNFKNNFSDNIYRYEEKEILDNAENFYNTISNKSFFETEKLIIISRATDKIVMIIDEIIEKKLDGITLILNSSLLEKKSKLRTFFEKNKNAICVPFYADENKTLATIANSFFIDKKIPISQQTINILVNRSRGDRKNLINEFDKIESFINGKKNISIDQILKLTNLAENYNVSELVDNCLAKNFKKTIFILSENNFSSEDCVLITRTLLAKSKRLHSLLLKVNEAKNIEVVISGHKPPIFWKDKEIIKQQIENWTIKKAEDLIYKTNEIELLVKKNSSNSLNILSDFIINQANRVSN